MSGNYSVLRLLDTRSGQFVLVPDPKTARYAILSHTWAAVGEQEYKAIADLQSSLSTSSETRSPSSRPTPTKSILSHPQLSSKIKRACEIAQLHGYDLLWMDACCIDKSSSAELSESLNSMFEWYRQASVCYVYLVDVSSDDDVWRHGSAFRGSRWHKRGWTLQELIAPANVVFLSNNWRPLGTKTTLAELLESITGIDTKILLHKAPLSSVSVARRMWWASSRETKRVEDEAYSLMGIFGVKIPMIYGEGHKAFILLQEEIWKTIPDQSLLAWGPKFPSQETVSPASLLRLIEERMAILDTPLTSFQLPPRSLLAVSPHDFRAARTHTPLTARRFNELVWDSSGPRFELEQAAMYTPLLQGVRVQFPVIPYASSAFSGTTLRPEQSSYRDCGCGPFECIWLALLRCTDDAGNIIALPLCEPPANSSSDNLLVGTRKDICLDCKRYYRTWALSPAAVRDMCADISITPLFVRRIPIEHMVSGTPALRIRRILVQPWCMSMLSAQGYAVSLRRTTANMRHPSEHASGHSLSLRRDSGGSRSSTSPATYIEEIELGIAQGDRADGVTYTVHYGSQLTRHGSGRDLRADTAPHAAPGPQALAPSPIRRADSTRLSHFVPFTGLGEARHEFELRAAGSPVAIVQKLYVTLQNHTEPAWTFGGWGQAAYVDFSLNVELSAGIVAAMGHDRRSSTM